MSERARVYRPVLEREDGKTYLRFPAADVMEARRLTARLKDGVRYTLVVSRERKSRSLGQNELMWRLCQVIAEAVGATKNEVYRQHIRDYGDWTSVLVKKDAAGAFKRQWESNGEGWLVEEHAPHGDAIVLRCYAGSSTYDTAQMTRMIGSLTDECRALGIETDERLVSLLAEIDGSRQGV